MGPERHLLPRPAATSWTCVVLLSAAGCYLSHPGEPGDGADPDRPDAHPVLDDGRDATDGEDVGGREDRAPAVCGDGIAEDTEECDDGNAVRGDGCDPDCRFGCQADGDCEDGDPCTWAVCAPGGTGRLCTAASATPPGIPLPLAPANGAVTGSVHAGSDPLRPNLRWRAPAADGCGSWTYEVQADDSCDTRTFPSCGFSSPEHSAVDLVATESRPANELPVSLAAPVGRRYFWRVRACRGAACSTWSPVRSIDVGRVRGDVDGDGYSDLAVGAANASVRVENEGCAWIHLGSAAGIGASPALSLEPPSHQSGALFGQVVSDAGDLNADGFGDLAVGAPAHDDAARDEGAVFVYFGGPGGPVATPSVVLPNPAHAEGGWFGGAAAAAGDVNGDGYGDLVVGAPSQTRGAIGEGNAFVYLGGQDGPAAAPSVVLDNPANQADGVFGVSVASAGDVNGDGWDDVIVGAYRQNGAAEEEGAAFLYFGSASGIPDAPSTSLPSPSGESGGLFGGAVAAAGDLDGDGTGDVASGAWQTDHDAWNEGLVYVYLGGGSGPDRDPSATLEDPAHQAVAELGFAIAAAGDIDGDGRGDVLVGQPSKDGTAEDEGAVWVWYGSRTGTVVERPTELPAPEPQFEGRFGRSVAGGGDIDGDGYDDVAIGAPWQDGDAPREGAVYVFYGSPGGLETWHADRLANPVHQTDSWFGRGLALPRGPGGPDRSRG